MFSLILCRSDFFVLLTFGGSGKGRRDDHCWETKGSSCMKDLWDLAKWESRPIELELWNGRVSGKANCLVGVKRPQPHPSLLPLRAHRRQPQREKAGENSEETPLSCGRGAVEWTLKHIHLFQNMDERLRQSDFWGFITNQWQIRMCLVANHNASLKKRDLYVFKNKNGDLFSWMCV